MSHNEADTRSNGICRYHGGKSLSGTAHGRYSRGHYTKDTIANRKEIMAMYRTDQRGGLEIADIYSIQSNILRCSKMQDFHVISCLLLIMRRQLD